MKLKCDCGYEWEYSGSMKHYATCPDCKRPVKLPTEVE